MKSLKHKLTLLILVSVSLVFLLVAFALNNSLKAYFVDEKIQQLHHQGREIQNAFLKDNLFNSIRTQEIFNEIETLERYFDQTIWLIDQRGYIYVSSADIDVEVIEGQLDIEEIKGVFSGQRIEKRRNNSNFFNEPVITMAYPIFNKDQEVVFALYLHTKVSGVMDAKEEVFKIIGFLFFFGVGGLVLAIYIFTHKMTQDLSNLNNGVKAISKGAYDYPLDSKRQDEIGQLTSSMKKMSKDLQTYENQRRAFISDISHDFRSPLTNIIGFSKGLLDHKLENLERERYLNIILEESQRLLHLSDDILELSKLQNPKKDLEIDSFDLEGLILEVVDTYEKKIEDMNLQVEITFNLKGKKVYGDEKLIRRVLQNLIDNSIKFNVEGGRFEISTQEKEEKAYIDIFNDTDEVLKEPLDDLFERFIKGDLSRNKSRESFGLGLSIVKEILDLHGSQLRAQKKNRGLLISFDLKS